MKWNVKKQTKFADFANPNSKQAGDCWRCCIAAVLGLDAEEVPNFLQNDMDMVGREGWKSMDELTQDWLVGRGYVLARVSTGWLCFDHVYGKHEARYPIIKCGPTPRSKRMHQHHAVVYIGDEMVYDPHPDGTGLTAVCEQYMVVKICQDWHKNEDAAHA